MSKDFKKGFLTGAGGITGVLSVPVGIIALIFLFSFLSPIAQKVIGVFEKEEFKEWRTCMLSKMNRSANEPDGIKALEILESDICGDSPRQWKWQLKK